MDRLSSPVIPAVLRLSLALLLSAGTSIVAVAPAFAQRASPNTGTRSFAIPAQPLVDAMREFSQVTGIQVVYAASTGSGVRSPGVSGTFSTAEALSRLLTGTGLTYRFTGPNAVTLEAAPQAAEGVIALGPVRVEAAGASTTYGGPTGLVNNMVLTEGDRSYTTGGPVNVGTGLGLTIRETPQSVTVITRQRLDDQSLITIGDALAQAPGIVFQPAGPGVGGRAPLYSRGYQINNYQVDGLTLPTAAFAQFAGGEGSGTLDTAIYDSVTILRGAPGILAGASNPAGTISLTRKRPTREFQVIASQSVARWNQHRTVGDVGSALNASGSIRARAIGVYDAGGGFQDRYDYRKLLGFGILEADLGPRTMLTLVIEHSDDKADSTGPYGGFAIAYTDGSPTPFTLRDNPAADWSGYDKRATTGTMMLDHRFNDRWKANLSYSHTNYATDLQFGLIASQPEPDGLVLLNARRYESKNKVDAVQLKVDGQFDLFGRSHDLVLGAYGSRTSEANIRQYFNFEYDLVQTSGWQGRYPKPDFDALMEPGSRYITKEGGLWAATRLRLADGLSVIAGGRVNWFDAEGYRLIDREPVEDRAYKGIFVPYIGATYDVSRALSLYASYTTIFTPQFSRDVNDRLLDPERGSNLELGVKGEWLDGRLNASASVFRVRRDNIAVQDGLLLTPRGEDAFRAEDDVTGKGWEVEIAGQIAPGLQVQGGYTRVLTKDSSGMRLFGDQPKHVAKGFASWTPQALPTLTVGGGVTWQSLIYADFLPEPYWRSRYAQGAYALADLFVRYALNDQASIAVNASNLFDKRYQTETTSVPYGTPRNIMVTLRGQF